MTRIEVSTINPPSIRRDNKNKVMSFPVSGSLKPDAGHDWILVSDGDMDYMT